MTDEIEFFERKIASAVNTESRIQLLNTASMAVHLSAPEQAYRWAQEAMQSAEALGNTRYIAECLFSLGTGSSSLANYHEALALFERAYKLYRELGDAPQAANSVGNIGL